MEHLKSVETRLLSFVQRQKRKFQQQQHQHHQILHFPPLSLSPSSSPSLSSIFDSPHEFAFSIAAGCIAFGTSLAMSTVIQGRILRISTGSIRPIPTLCGMTSVGFASLASHYSSCQTQEFIRSKRKNKMSMNSSTKTNRYLSSTKQHESAGKYLTPRHGNTHHHNKDDMISFHGFTASKQKLQICVLGLVVFQVLGGRFWAIAPSSYTHIGSYARHSLPATSKYATAVERSMITRLGRTCGCHTCGRRIRQFGETVIADHQPPLAVVAQMNQNTWRRITGMSKTTFRFYPHCMDCSKRQGTLLSKATAAKVANNGRVNLAGAGGGRMAYNHGFQFRWNHLTGGMVAAVVATTTSGSSEE